MRQILGIVPLAVLLLTGCGAEPVRPETTPVGEDGPAPVDALPGREFAGTEIVEDGERREPAEGTELTIGFTLHGGIAFSGGCNQSSGPVDTTDGRLEVPADGVASTLVACTGPLQDQDRLLSELLRDGPLWRLDGSRLTVSGEGTEVVLRDVTPPNAEPAGTTWTVREVLDADRRRIPVAKPATLTFTADTVEVDTGCNTGSAGYTATGDALRFDGPPTLTRMACADDVMLVERALTEVLAGEVRYRADDATLSLAHPSHAGLDAGR